MSRLRLATLRVAGLLVALPIVLAAQPDARGGGQCGDGDVTGGEQCDDGDFNGNSECGCQDDCTYPPTDTFCDDETQCTVSTCDGAGSCAFDDFEPVETPCGDSNHSDCDHADSCDEAGVCQTNVQPNETPCTQDSLFCNGAEECLDGSCLSPGSPCGFEACNEESDACEAPGPLGDIDGDGDVEPLTDGLLFLRYLFGFRDATLVNGAYDTVNCSRCTADEMESFIEGLL